MTDPRWTDAAEILVAKVLAVGGYDSAGPEERDTYRIGARAILTGLADGGYLTRVRTWHEDDAEPNVPAVRDNDFDVYDKVKGGWMPRYAGPGAPAWTWETLRGYAPIVEVPPS